MKRYIVIISIIAFLISITTIVIQKERISSLKKERARLAENQSSLLGDIVRYRTKDSLNAVSVEKLTLKKKELETYRSDLAKQVKDLNIKLKRVESISQTSIKTEIGISAKLRDTVIIHDTIQCFKFEDKHISVFGCIENDTVDLSARSSVKITQVLHRVPKSFWFIKYGTKAIRQEIIADNPYTELEYSEYIELK